jgi:hypothetical protein
MFFLHAKFMNLFTHTVPIFLLKFIKKRNSDLLHPDLFFRTFRRQTFGTPGLSYPRPFEAGPFVPEHFQAGPFAVGGFVGVPSAGVRVREKEIAVAS